MYSKPEQNAAMEHSHIQMHSADVKAFTTLTRSGKHDHSSERSPHLTKKQWDK